MSEYVAVKKRIDRTSNIEQAVSNAISNFVSPCVLNIMQYHEFSVKRERAYKIKEARKGTRNHFGQQEKATELQK